VLAKTNKTKSKIIMWIVLWAIATLAFRVFVAIAAEPLFELLPSKVSRITPLVGDVTLLIRLYSRPRPRPSPLPH
jgi:hypothetical protein